MKAAIILGTRPEIIKFSPLIKELAVSKHKFFVVHSGQHYSKDMSEDFFTELNIGLPKYNLLSLARSTNYELRIKNSRRNNSSLAEMLPGIIKILKKEKPDMVVVQGDTKTALAGALAASHLNIKLAHLEAGLRSFDDNMPEEINRIVIDQMSNLLFCPTKTSKDNLKREKIKGNIQIVGNTIADVLTESSQLLPSKRYLNEDYALLTLHRPSNVDNPEDLKAILNILGKISEKYHLKIFFPVHPRTRKVIKLNKIELPKKIIPITPMKYAKMIHALRDAKLIFTDSGGLQEEACILQVPCITLRENTERPETLDIGANILVGNSEKKIFSAVNKMLSSKRDWLNPYGRNVSKKILKVLEKD